MLARRIFFGFVVLLAVAALVGAGCQSDGGEAAEGEAKEGKKSAKAKPKPKPKPVPEPEPEPENKEPTLEERLKPPADVAKPPKDAEKAKLGFHSKVIEPGTGDKTPGRDDTAFVHYTAWTPEGKVADSTYKRNNPRIMKMTGTLKGWTEAIGMMKVGEKRRVWLPPKLAHPKRSKKDFGLTVDMELVKLKVAPPAPADVKRPPKDAIKTASGLAFKVMAEGKGKNPGAKDQVTVRYAGWTTDGRCFDHTAEDETMSFSLDGVIRGWSEGLRMMSPGAKARFWIPEKLAYEGQAGKPKGMLVFDIEVVEITETPQ